MKYLSSGIGGEAKHPKALVGGTMAAAPIINASTNFFIIRYYLIFNF